MLDALVCAVALGIAVADRWLWLVNLPVAGSLIQHPIPEFVATAAKAKEVEDCIDRFALQPAIWIGSGNFDFRPRVTNPVTWAVDLASLWRTGLPDRRVVWNTIFLH